MLKPDQTPKATTLVKTYFKVVFSKTLKTRQTVRAYQNAIDSLEAFVSRPVHLGMVTADLLKQWLSHLIEEVDGDVSGKTAYQYRRRLISIVQAAFPEIELVKSEPPVPGSLLSYFEAYYRVERMVGTKPASIELMRGTIRKFDRYLGRPATLADLNQRVVGEFFNSMLVVEKLSRATVNQKRGDLFALWRFAHRKQEVLELPDIPKLREYRRLPNAWTTDELSRILRTARAGAGSKTGFVGHFPAGDWWLAFLLVCYDTAGRVSAVRSVRFADVDFDHGQITFQAETQKQKVEQRFRLHEQTIEALQRLRLPFRQSLFEWPYRPEYLFVCLRRILKSAELPTDRKRFFHCIRRTSATLIAAASGIEAAARHLGHSTSDITKRYIDPKFTSERDATSSLPRPMLGGAGD